MTVARPLLSFTLPMSRFPVRPLFSLLAFLGAGACGLGAVRGDDSSVRGFVSVEPFEVRLEAIAKVAAFAPEWGFEEDAVTPADRPGMLESFEAAFVSGVELESPDASVRFARRTVRFVREDPVQGYAEDDRDVIPLEEALVGLTLSADARGLRRFDLRWRWYAPGQERLVLEIASAGRPAARYLTPDRPELRWESEEGAAERLPELLPVPAAGMERRRPLRYALYPGVVLLTVSSLATMRWQRETPGWVFTMGALGLFCAVGSVKFVAERVVAPDESAAEEIVHALLRNIYHAFDFREETEIYDTLAASVGGRLLERVYLEIRESLELETRGGPRVRVYEVALREVSPLSFESSGSGRGDAGGGGSVRYRVEWATVGEVTHWGHTHERTNRYEAEMALAADFGGVRAVGGEEEADFVEGAWRVVGLDLIDEERVQRLTRREVEPEDPESPEARDVPEGEEGEGGEPSSEKEGAR